MIRHFFTNRRIQDEYAMIKASITDFQILIKTIDKFGKSYGWTQGERRHRPWMIDADKCLDFTMCMITKKASREQIVAECTATLGGEYNERLQIFTDGSLKDERVGYAIVTPETTIKNRMRSHTTIFSAKQEDIINAI
jgi:hypothetical protein